MDGLRDFLEAVRQHGLIEGNLRGLFHILIGRRITKADGTVISTGLTWRQLANLLKTLRFEPELVAQVGADPDSLAPRDRQRFWYSAIALAKPDSPEARAEADRLAAAIKPLGYVIGPGPAAAGRPAAPPKPPAEPEAEPQAPPKKAEGGGKGKKRKK